MSPQVRWTVMIVGLLGLSVLIHVIMLVVALSDPSFAVEEDYYQKGVAWDERQQQQRRNEDLGWSVDIDTDVAGARGEVKVTVSVRDGDEAPVEHAMVDLETFHNARASRILRKRLEERDVGVYDVVLPMRQSGVWEFRLEIERSDDRFTLTRKQMVAVRR